MACGHPAAKAAGLHELSKPPRQQVRVATGRNLCLGPPVKRPMQPHARFVKQAFLHALLAVSVLDWAAPAPALFNLGADIGEKNNLAAAQPEKLKELVARYDAWSSQMREPMWERGAKNRKAGARKKQGAGGDKLDARFKQLDKDGDGKLSASELPRPKVFRQMDRDRDGSVTLAEARAYWVARQ